LSPVSTRIRDRLLAAIGLPSRYATKPVQLSFVYLGLLNRVPALNGWGIKGGNVTSAGWQVKLCDPTWHVSFRNGEACFELRLLYFYKMALCSQVCWLVY